MKKNLTKNPQLVDTINTKVDDIANCIKNSLQINPDLMGGKVGEMLFWANYSIHKEDEIYLNKVTTLLTEIFEDIKKGFNYPTFAGGLAGIGWAVEHLVKNDFINADTNEIIGSLDDFLYPIMINYIREGNYDYLHGALGIGLYYLSRSSNPKKLGYLSNLVDELERQSTQMKNGIAWETILVKDENLKGFNLSMSHGISSIIVFLSKLYLDGIDNEKVSNLLNGAVEYLLNQQLDILNYKSNFPSWVSTEKPLIQSRLAWCYGDLGIGIALWQAGNNIGKEEWKDRAVKILLDVSKRRDIKENLVFDAGLCHGTSGIAHIFNRMYTNTGLREFKNTADYWFSETLKMAKYEDGLAGYKVWRVPEYGGLQNQYGFLEGIAGIGLSLISAISDIEPKWDECLLLS